MKPVRWELLSSPSITSQCSSGIATSWGKYWVIWRTKHQSTNTTVLWIWSEAVRRAVLHMGETKQLFGWRIHTIKHGPNYSLSHDAMMQNGSRTQKWVTPWILWPKWLIMTSGSGLLLWEPHYHLNTWDCPFFFNWKSLSGGWKWNIFKNPEEVHLTTIGPLNSYR